MKATVIILLAIAPWIGSPALADMLHISGLNTVTVCSEGHCGRNRRPFERTILLDIDRDACRRGRKTICGSYRVPRDPGSCANGPVVPDDVGVVRARRGPPNLFVFLESRNVDAYVASLRACIGSLKLLAYTQKYRERTISRREVRAFGSVILRLKVRAGGRTLLVRDEAAYHVDNVVPSDDAADTR